MKTVFLTTARVDKRFKVTIQKKIKEGLKLTTYSELVFFSVDDPKELLYDRII